MHIAINAQLLNTDANYRGAGVSNYSQQLLLALGQLVMAGETARQISAFVNDSNFAAPGIDLRRSPLALRNPLRRIFWEQTKLPGALTAINANLVHGLVNVLPLTSRVPGVVTVHDLSFIRMPEKFRTAKRAYLSALCRLSVLRAERVIAVSQQTADDLMQLMRVPASKIDVIHHGVAANFTPGNQIEITQFRDKQGLPERYLFYLGTLEPRKNLDLLVRAFAGWRKEAGASAEDVKLVLAGAKGWFYEAIFQQVQALGLEKQVIFPGFIAAETLPQWYQAATVFVYPSLLEGFGLPLLEAMACGVPVVCSQTPSLLEVAGDAALTFVPNDEQALIGNLKQVLGDDATYRDLRKRGLARTQQFSWQRCAKETLHVYETAR